MVRNTGFLRLNSLRLDIFEFFGVFFYLLFSFLSFPFFIVFKFFPFLWLGKLLLVILFVSFLVFFYFAFIRKYQIKIIVDLQEFFVKFLIILFLVLIYASKGQALWWDDFTHFGIIKNILHSGRFRPEYLSPFGEGKVSLTYFYSSFHFIFASIISLFNIRLIYFHHYLSYIFIPANFGIISLFLKVILKERFRYLVALILWYIILVYIGSFIWVEAHLWYAPLKFFFSPLFWMPFVSALFFVFIENEDYLNAYVVFLGFLFFAFTLSLMYYFIFLICLFYILDYKEHLEKLKFLLLIGLVGLPVIAIRYYTVKLNTPDIYSYIKNVNLFKSIPCLPFHRLPFGVTFWSFSKTDYVKFLLFFISILNFFIFRSKIERWYFYFPVSFFLVYFPPLGFIWYKILGLWLYARLHYPVGLFASLVFIPYLEYLLKLKKFSKKYLISFLLFVTFLGPFLPLVKNRFKERLYFKTIPENQFYSLKEVDRVREKFGKINFIPYAYVLGCWHATIFNIIVEKPLKLWFCEPIVRDIGVRPYGRYKTPIFNELSRRYRLWNFLKSGVNLKLDTIQKILEREKIKYIFLQGDTLPVFAEKLLNSFKVRVIKGRWGENGPVWWFFEFLGCKKGR